MIRFPLFFILIQPFQFSAELNTLLDVPLASSGFVGKYPTKKGKLQTAGLQCKF
jgi:hypothetical protein